MRADVVVVFQPCFDDGFGLVNAHEPFGIKNFPAERSIEALVIAVLPR
jgi:hypothetical protein